MLEKIAYFYIITPLIVWGCTWFNLPTTVVFLLSLFMSCYSMDFKTSGATNNSFFLSKKTVILAIIVATVWCFWSGIGGYVFQSDDFVARNAVFRDLIQNAWPVYYDAGDYALNYYFGYWLIPALITKVMKVVCSFDGLFVVGLNVLLLYTIIGVSIFLLLLISFIQPQNRKQLFLVLLFPLLFSGLDIIGAIINKMPLFNAWVWNLQNPQYPHIHLEVYNGYGGVQYSSLTTQLFWVFNQAVPSWIITLLLLKEKSPQNYGILITSAMFLCPLPAVGLAIFMLVYGYLFLFKTQLSWKDKMMKVFSLSNAFIVPVFAIVVGFLSLHGDSNPLGFSAIPIGRYLLFVTLEFGCYAFFIFHLYYRSPLFGVTLLSLLTLMLFSFKEGYIDFQARTTIPAILILGIFVLKYLLSERANKFNKIVLSCLLAIGMCTPVIEFTRGFVHIISEKSIYHTNDSWYSLAQKEFVWPFSNYKVDKPYINPYYQVLVRSYDENDL